MEKKEIEYIQNRLSLLNSGKKVAWSLRDRAIVSFLCIEAVEHSVQATGLVFCLKCNLWQFKNAAGGCGVCNPPRA